MVKLVASDLDGTIIDKNNNISSKNFIAMNNIVANNIPFVICTGKTYPIIKNICSDFNATYGVFSNGSQIVDLTTGEEIFKKTLSLSEVLNCLKLAKSNKLHVHLYTFEEIITENPLYMDLRNYKLAEKTGSLSSLGFKVVDNIEEYIKSFNPDVCKLIISSENSLDFIQTSLSTIDTISIHKITKRGKFRDYILDKDYEYLDIIPAGINKGSALKFLQEYLNINTSDILAIGDNINDIDMLSASGIGVAVANSYDELKKIANYTTKSSVEQGAFAEAVYKFIPF